MKKNLALAFCLSWLICANAAPSKPQSPNRLRVLWQFVTGG